VSLDETPERHGLLGVQLLEVVTMPALGKAQASEYDAAMQLVPWVVG
jgi:hypothetical protein